MTDEHQALAADLSSRALCATTHPADAATALIVAAAAILCARFEPPAIALLIRRATDEALALGGHVGTAGTA